MLRLDSAILAGQTVLVHNHSGVLQHSLHADRFLAHYLFLLLLLLSLVLSLLLLLLDLYLFLLLLLLVLAETITLRPHRLEIAVLQSYLANHTLRQGQQQQQHDEKHVEHDDQTCEGMMVQVEQPLRADNTTTRTAEEQDDERVDERVERDEGTSAHSGPIPRLAPSLPVQVYVGCTDMNHRDAAGVVDDDDVGDGDGG